MGNRLNTFKRQNKNPNISKKHGMTVKKIENLRCEMVKLERFLLSKYCLASSKLQSPSSVAHFLIPRYLYFFTFCHFPFVFRHLQTSTNPTRSTTPYSEAVQKKKKNSPYQPPPWQGGGVFALRPMNATHLESRPLTPPRCC